MAMPRLRIFAGPNGSGKSTLFEAFSKRYETGYFINADLIENELSAKGFVDLSDYGLDLTQSDWEAYSVTERGRSLIKKSIAANHTIDISIKENVIVDKEKETHSYEGALISAFLRYHLQEKERDFCFETVMSHPSKIEEVTEAGIATFYWRNLLGKKYFSSIGESSIPQAPWNPFSNLKG